MGINAKLDNLINNKEVFGKVFLFYGEEKYYRDTYINKIRRIFGDLLKGINYIILDDTNVLNLISEANTPAFGYENKLIIVNNSKIFMAKRSKKDENNTKEVETESISNVDADIISFLENEIPSNVTIIFNEEDVTKTKKTYKLLDKKGVVNEFKKLSENDIVSYVINLCKKYGVLIDKSTATYFVNVVSNNMDDVINEIRKLIEYTGKDKEITKQSIDLITIKQIEAVIFDLTDYLGKRDIKKSIQLLDDLIYQKEPLQKIYIMIYKHFKNLYLIKTAQEQKINNVNEQLGLHPFVFNKCVYQTNNYATRELTRIYKDFMQIDIDNKSGNIDLYTGIINVMCSIK